MTTKEDSRNSGRWVYARYIRRNGRIVYPKNGRVFRFWVDDAK